MQVKLLRDARVQHKAGEIVEINDPAALHFLVSTGSAVVLRTAAPETPEARMEAPEVKAVKKTTTRKKAK